MRRVAPAAWTLATLAAVAACSSNAPAATTCGGTAFTGVCLIQITLAQGEASTCPAGGGPYSYLLEAGQTQFTFQPEGPGGSSYECTQRYDGCSLTRSCQRYGGGDGWTDGITFAPDGTLSGTHATTTAAGSGCTYDVSGGDCSK
jgi:hypothetical protein